MADDERLFDDLGIGWYFDGIEEFFDDEDGDGGPGVGDPEAVDLKRAGEIIGDLLDSGELDWDGPGGSTGRDVRDVLDGEDGDARGLLELSETVDEDDGAFFALCDRVHGMIMDGREESVLRACRMDGGGAEFDPGPMLDAVEDVSCTLMVESDDTRVLFRLLSVPLVFSETGGRTPYRRFRDPGFGDSMREAGALGDGFNVYVLPRILSPDQVAMPLRNRIGILESMVGAVLGQSDEGEAMELVPERDPALVRPTAPGLGYLLILSAEPVGDGVTLSALTGAPDGWRLFEEYGKWAHSFAPKLSRAVFSGKKAQVTPPDVRIAIPSSVSSANAHGSMLARVVALLPTRSESSRILKEHGGPLDFSVDERPGTGMEPLVRVRARGPDGDVAFERVQAVSYHEGVVEVMAMIALEGAGHKCIRKVETPFAPEAGSSSG